MPRLPDFPHTAPAYDEVTKPVRAPYPAACITMRGDCRCYTQQGTLLQTSRGTCMQIVNHGFFMDWEEGGDGICMECVDHNNYAPATRDTLRRLLDGPCRWKRTRALTP